MYDDFQTIVVILTTYGYLISTLFVVNFRHKKILLFLVGFTFGGQWGLPQFIPFWNRYCKWKIIPRYSRGIYFYISFKTFKSSIWVFRNKKNPHYSADFFVWCGQWGIRTPDPLGVNEVLWTNWANCPKRMQIYNMISLYTKLFMKNLHFFLIKKKLWTEMVQSQ